MGLDTIRSRTLGDGPKDPVGTPPTGNPSVRARIRRPSTKTRFKHRKKASST